MERARGSSPVRSYCGIMEGDAALRRHQTRSWGGIPMGRKRKARKRKDLFDAVGERIERLPVWAQPIAYGPLLLALMMAMRGALIGLPIIVIVVLFRSSQPWTELARIVALLAFAFGGSALGGALYSFIGRWLKQVPVVGAYLTGMLVVGGYALCFFPIVRLAEGRSLVAPPDGAEWFSYAFCTILFGIILGHMLFRQDPSGFGRSAVEDRNTA